MKTLKFIPNLFFILSVVSITVIPAVTFDVTGSLVAYQINGKSYEGYYITPSD